MCCEIANSITPMLRWTPDWPSANSNSKLPVLDLSIWCQEMEKGTVTFYQFYSKPMTNPVSIPANSALSSNVKFSTYRQEVFRVLRNTSVDLSWREKAELLSYMSWRMMISGYSTGFRIQAICGGLIGHLRILYRSVKDEINIHRNKEEILQQKSAKGGVKWFKRNNPQCRSVLFIPATPGSTLANTVRDLERKNRQGRKTRIKVVEQSGRTVRNTVVKNYPWAVSCCEDPLCFPCSSGGTVESKVSCRHPGIGYKITCLLCNDVEVVALYHGESGRNLYSRGKEHLQGLSSGLKTNCLVIHNNVHHDGSQEAHFKMEATGVFSKAIDRQIDESVRMKYHMKKGGILLNSGSEWRGDSVPRANFYAPGLDRRRRR